MSAEPADIMKPLEGFDIIQAFINSRTRQHRKALLVAHGEFLSGSFIDMMLTFMSNVSKWKDAGLPRYRAMLTTIQEQGLEPYFDSVEREWAIKHQRLVELHPIVVSAIDSPDVLKLLPEYNALLEDMSFMLPEQDPSLLASLYHFRGIAEAQAGHLRNEPLESMAACKWFEKAYEVFKEIGDQGGCLWAASALAKVGFDTVRSMFPDGTDSKIVGGMVLMLEKILEKYRIDLDSDHPAAIKLAGQLAMISSIAAIYRGEAPTGSTPKGDESRPTTQTANMIQNFFGIFGLINDLNGRPELSGEEKTKIFMERFLTPFVEAAQSLTPETNLELWLGTRELAATSSLAAMNEDEAIASMREAILTARQLVLTTTDEDAREKVLRSIARITEKLASLSAASSDISQTYWTIARGRTIRSTVYTALSSIENDPALAEVLEKRDHIAKLRNDLIPMKAAMSRLSETLASEHATDGDTEARWRPMAELRARHDQVEQELKATSKDFQELLRTKGIFASLDPPSLEVTSAAVPQGGVAVLVLAGADAGWALLIPHGIREVRETRLLELPDLTTARIDELVGSSETEAGWLPAYNRFKDQLRRPMRVDGPETAAFSAEIDRIGASLWSILMGPIDGALRELGIASDGSAEVLLMPPGRLAILPLHAAWRANADGQPRIFLEDWAVSIAQSPQALAASANRLRSRDAGGYRVLGVTDPLGDLSEAIGETLVNPGLEAFSEQQREELRGQGATKSAVLEAISRASHVLFYCHGVWDPGSPAASGLVMAADTEQSLRSTWYDVLSYNDLEVTGKKFANSRLWVLAACETAAVDLAFPDEFSGIGTGLANQVPGVLSTLFPVDAATTNAAIRAFMKLHVGAKLSPAQALRRVQLALRQGRHAIDALIGDSNNTERTKEFAFTRPMRLAVPLIFADADEDHEPLPDGIDIPVSEDAWKQAYLWCGYQFSGL